MKLAALRQVMPWGGSISNRSKQTHQVNLERHLEEFGVGPIRTEPFKGFIFKILAWVKNSESENQMKWYRMDVFLCISLLEC